MNTSQNPIMTVTGIRKSQGDFANDAGKNIEFSNTVVTVLQDYSERELEQGAIGKKSTDYKIKGAQFFNDYLHQQLPADAGMIFQWDFTGKVPKAILIALDFGVGKKLLDSKAYIYNCYSQVEMSYLITK